VTGISGDSRQVAPGYLFVARSGQTFEGHDFIPDAVRSGAAVVVGERPASAVRTLVPYLRVRDGQAALAWLAAAWHDHPARQMVMIGVTGTDGKTTTVNLLYQILRAAGLKAGMISTVNAVIGDETHDTGLHVTTPPAPQVQHYLAQMVSAGTTHAVLETTSHGLAQHRVTACAFDVAVVTNITHEHLDYHGDWEAYFAAKARLFEGLRTAYRKQDPQHPGRRLPKLAVLNADDASFQRLQDIDVERTLSYGLPGAAATPTHRVDVTAHDVIHAPDATRFILRARLPGQRARPTPCRAQDIPLTTSLIGTYNISNVLAAATAALGLGLTPRAIQAGVRALQGIPGRMERVSDASHPFLAIVDFAHTPNALRQALQTAQTLVGDGGRVIAVWGSAGLRDREKRRLMGTVSAQLADLTVITAEDPRTESLEKIMAESAAACEAAGRQEGRDFWRVADRGQAIRFATEMARPGDVVIVCGKGHEQSMCFGSTEYPWDDREALRRALQGETLDTLPTAPTRTPADNRAGRAD
jgi:UDP-N-acetylmuramoyl-L-alanyl-D-glutamate--2,6-diaminopimelate ligase